VTDEMCMCAQYLQAAFVENLNGSQLYDSMYAEDSDGHKISKLPGVEELLITYKEKFTDVCLKLFEYGLQAHREREEELKMFHEALEAEKLDNRQQAAVKIDEFMVYKHKVGSFIRVSSSSSSSVISVFYFRNKQL